MISADSADMVEVCQNPHVDALTNQLNSLI
jgi:hypothetical protein